MEFLAFLVVALLWCSIGFPVAGKSAAWRYDHSSYRNETTKLSQAKGSYWFTILGGPVGVLVYLFRTLAGNPIEQSLLRNSESYRNDIIKAGKFKQNREEFNRRHSIG